MGRGKERSLLSVVWSLVDNTILTLAGRWIVIGELVVLNSMLTIVLCRVTATIWSPTV